MPNVKLLSADGKYFEVDADLFKCSATIQGVLKQCNQEENGAFMPLPAVSAKILDLVIIWAAKHKDDPPFVVDYNDRNITEWDEDFLRIDDGTLTELTQAASYLGIEALYHTGCKLIAKKINGTSALKNTHNYPPEKRMKKNHE